METNPTSEEMPGVDKPETQEPPRNEAPKRVQDAVRLIGDKESMTALLDLIHSDWLAHVYLHVVGGNDDLGLFYGDGLFVRFIGQITHLDYFESESILRFGILPRAKRLKTMLNPTVLKPTYGTVVKEETAPAPDSVMPPTMSRELAEAFADIALYIALPHLIGIPFDQNDRLAVVQPAQRYRIGSTFVSYFNELAGK